MKIDILNALTDGDCPKAILLSTKLYNSKYSDNEIRMLYSTSNACVAGIRFYTMLDSIASSNFSALTDIFKSLVKMFPSRTALDSTFQSTLYAQDALQAMLKDGAIIAPADKINFTSYNPGSARAIDRTLDSNLFLLFVSMGELGSGLNRYGFNPSDDPAASSYVKTISLSWTSKALVQADTTGAACGIPSALYNMFDALSATSGILPSGAAGAMSNVFTILSGVLDVAAQNNCTADSYSTAECDAAIARLRYRNACSEQGAAASAAAGIIQAVNAGWI